MPQNKKLYIGIGIVVVLIIAVAAAVVYKTYRDNQIVSAVYNETIDRPEIDLSFSYPSGEYGLSLIEPPVTEGSDLLDAFILMPADEYTELTQSTDGRESPPAISIFVFDLPDVPTTTATDTPDRTTRLKTWATEKTTLTSFATPLTPPVEVKIDGLTMLNYRADGLYQQNIYLASYKGRAYMFVSQFNSETDMTFTAFSELMSYVAFN